MIEILKLAACLPFLLYSSYLDLKTRMVPNHVWKLMLLYLSVFLLYEVLLWREFYLLRVFFSSVSTFSLTYLLFKLKVFGGADAKALTVIGILVPVYPFFEFNGIKFPLLGVPPIGLFSLTVLGYAFLITVIVPLGLFCYNLVHFSADMPQKPVYMFFAYRIKISDLQRLLEQGRYIRLAERLELSDEKLNHFFVCRGIEVSQDTLCQLEEYNANGFLDNLVWVTPRIPFLLFITAGFILAAIFGDLIHYLMENLTHIL